MKKHTADIPEAELKGESVMNKVRFGVIGVGRLGFEHASNIASRIPNAELIGVCDANAARANEVAEQLGATAYTDPKEMCANPDIDAIAIVTNTSSHVEMIKLAMEAGKHVFCEKPLAENIEKCKEAEKIIEAHKDLIFMLGFMRRFDFSYEVAKKKIENGDIGDIVLVRCYSQDPRAIIEGTLEYAPRSGGQFIDMSIHDIDLIRWLTGSEVDKLWAVGGCFEFPQYADWDDGDNVSCLMQMKNKIMAFFYAGRTAAHGSAVETEIVGTKGMLRIGATPTDSLIQVYSEHGVCQECYQDFVTRWHQAYIREFESYCDAVLNHRQPEPNVYDGTNSTRIAFQCRESFLRNELISM
jgi:myo-inositol 2-dehydrogenase/D-chiro-inositol 1-dehydrogenase